MMLKTRRFPCSLLLYFVCSTMFAPPVNCIEPPEHFVGTVRVSYGSYAVITVSQLSAPPFRANFVDPSVASWTNEQPPNGWVTILEMLSGQSNCTTVRVRWSSTKGCPEISARHPDAPRLWAQWKKEKYQDIVPIVGEKYIVQLFTGKDGLVASSCQPYSDARKAAILKASTAGKKMAQPTHSRRR